MTTINTIPITTMDVEQVICTLSQSDIYLLEYSISIVNFLNASDDYKVQLIRDELIVQYNILTGSNIPLVL